MGDYRLQNIPTLVIMREMNFIIINDLYTYDQDNYQASVIL